jgi:hypothetical protein
MQWLVGYPFQGQRKEYRGCSLVEGLAKYLKWKYRTGSFIHSWYRATWCERYGTKRTCDEEIASRGRSEFAKKGESSGDRNDHFKVQRAYMRELGTKTPTGVFVDEHASVSPPPCGEPDDRKGATAAALDNCRLDPSNTGGLSDTSCSCSGR